MRMGSLFGIIHLLLVVVLMLSGCNDTEQPQQPATTEPVYDGTIIAMGDSLTAGLGVAPEQSYPALLAQRLQAAGLNYRVINAGISGETSSGARSRIDWIVRGKPDLVIVETGANDGFRGIDVELVKRNIAQIIETLLANDIGVVLAGMEMVANLGPEYRSAFNSIYPDLAAQYPVTFMPFFLEGVATQPHLNQEDGIHPNAAGYRVIVDNLWPYVLAALKQPEQRQEQ